MSDEPFLPDWVSPPGDTIADLLREKQQTELDLALYLGLSLEETRALLRGEMILTIDLAILLAIHMGSTVSFWMEREAQYRADMIRNYGGRSSTAEQPAVNRPI